MALMCFVLKPVIHSANDLLGVLGQALQEGCLNLLCSQLL